MSTISEQGVLEIGVNEMTAFVLRPATLADTYAAAAAVPVPEDIGTDRAASIAYQMAIDDALILCQLTHLGGLCPVPTVQELVAAVDPDDMAILRAAAFRLKKKLRQPRPSSPPTGEPNTSSSAPASA